MKSGRAKRGGFHRRIRLGVFIRDHLLGLGPEGSTCIDPDTGACQEDIFREYRSALRRAYAIKTVDQENEQRIAAGMPIYTETQYRSRLEYHLNRRPPKLLGCRYHSFSRYFHLLKQLGWTVPTGQEFPSRIQQHYSDAPSRTYYRLTQKGRDASDNDWSNPQAVLYPSR